MRRRRLSIRLVAGAQDEDDVRKDDVGTNASSTPPPTAPDRARRSTHPAANTRSCRPLGGHQATFDAVLKMVSNPQVPRRWLPAEKPTGDQLDSLVPIEGRDHRHAAGSSGG